ncbi:hypothetical protein ACFLUH_02870 [Chloroflexota bacterium]
MQFKRRIQNIREIGPWGWGVSVLTGILSGVPIVVAFKVFELSSSETNIPTIYWAIPLVLGLVGFGLSLCREVISIEQLQVANNQLDVFRVVAYKMGGIHWELMIRAGLAGITGQYPSRRANVMLINKDANPNVLEIRYHYRMDDTPDLNLKWEKREGCCGKAWADGKQKKADLKESTEQLLKDYWQMNSTNIQCTKDVKSIISIPLRDIKSRDNIIGVINCDSIDPLEVSKLGDDDFINSMEEHAEIISIILYAKGIIEGINRNG